MGLSIAFLRLFYFGLARLRPRLSIVTAVVIMALTTIMSSRMALIKDGAFMEMLRPAGRRVTLNFLETWSCWHQMPDVYIKSVSKSQLVRTSSSLQDAPPCRFPSSFSSLELSPSIMLFCGHWCSCLSCQDSWHLSRHFHTAGLQNKYSLFGITRS